jgi:hypothetical protein
VLLPIPRGDLIADGTRLHSVYGGSGDIYVYPGAGRPCGSYGIIMEFSTQARLTELIYTNYIVQRKLLVIVAYLTS